MRWPRASYGPYVIRQTATHEKCLTRFSVPLHLKPPTRGAVCCRLQLALAAARNRPPRPEAYIFYPRVAALARQCHAASLAPAVKCHKVVRTQRPVYKAHRAVLDDVSSSFVDVKSAL